MTKTEKPIWLKRTLSGFDFVSALDREIVSEKYGVGSTVRADLRKPRSGRQQRWYWALIRTVWKHQSFYASPEGLHKAIKMRLGLVDHFRMHNGDMIIEIQSTDYDSMDGGQFNEHVNRTYDLIANEILPGLKARERRMLIDEIDKLIAPLPGRE